MGHIPAAGRPHGAAPVPAEHVKSCPLCLLYKGKASELRISAQTVRRGGEGEIGNAPKKRQIGADGDGEEERGEGPTSQPRCCAASGPRGQQSCVQTSHLTAAGSAQRSPADPWAHRPADTGWQSPKLPHGRPSDPNAGLSGLQGVSMETARKGCSNPRPASPTAAARR